MITNFKRILFDFDGTLIIHNKENEVRDFATLLNINEEYFPMFERDISNFFENIEKEFHGRIMTREGYLDAMSKLIPSLELMNITAEVLERAFVKKVCLNAKIADGVVDTLSYLKKEGYALCILTNGFYIPQVKILKYFGLFDYFENVYAWDGTFVKPDVRFIRKALANTEPSYNLLIGDNLVNDIKMANKAGVRAIYVNRGGSRRRKGIKPYAVIKQLPELKQML